MAAKKMAASTVVQRNLPYLRQQFGAALKTCSVVVRVLSLALFLCYFLSYSRSASLAVCVTPGYIIPPSFWIWTAFTHAFFENRIWMVIADIITVGLCGKLIEPLWGAIEMLTFFAIVNTSVAFLSVVYYIILYSITWDPVYLFSVHIHGLAGYCAGVMVAVKQIMPDHVLISLPFGKLRNRNVPLTVLLFTIILWACRILRGTYPVMFTSGVLSSWIYLRFYQYHSNGSKGDMADHFTFARYDAEARWRLFSSRRVQKSTAKQLLFLTLYQRVDNSCLIASDKIPTLQSGGWEVIGCVSQIYAVKLSTMDVPVLIGSGTVSVE